MKLHIKFDSYCETTREAESDDQWDQGDSYTSKSLDSVSLSESFYSESIEVENDFKVGDKIYVVWSHWGSGNSFGEDRGCYAEIHGVFSADKETFAEQLAAELRKSSGYEVVFDGNLYYTPWNGYFDSLEDVHCDLCIVK